MSGSYDEPSWDLSDPGDRRIRLFVDVSCETPLWNGDGVPGYPDELPLSDQLQQDLLSWAERYDAADTAEHMYPEGNPAFDVDGFNAEGAALAERLRAELGPEWTVEHLPLTRAPPGWPERSKPPPPPAPLPPPRTREVLRPEPPRFDSGAEPVPEEQPRDREQEASRSHRDEPRSELRDGMLMLSLHPCYEAGFCYAVLPLWRGEHALPPGLLRHWAIKQHDLPEPFYVPAREPMFAAFTDALLHGVVGRWESKNDDVSLAVVPAAMSPFLRRHWDMEGERWRLHDPAEDGFEVQMLFRARQEAAFAPANSGIALRLAVTRAALEWFTHAFAREHRALNLKDRAASEAAGRFVARRFDWPVTGAEQQ